MPRGPRRNLRPVAASRSQPSVVDVDVELADRLARVEQERHAGLPGQRADRFRGVDHAAAGRDVRERDDGDVAVEPAFELVEVDLAVLVVLDHLERGAGALARLQERDRVADVLGARGEDALARLERDRRERHVPGGRRALHQRDLVRLRVDEPRDRVVHAGHPRLGLGLRLVRADLRLAAQVRDHGVGDHLRPQRSPGVVQVGDMVDAGRVTAGAVEIDRHDPGV